MYRQEPVYARYYEYTVDRWGHSRWIVTRADDHSTPFWADLSNEHFDSADVIGNEKLSDRRTEDYVVYVIVGGKSYRREVSLDVWTRLIVGDGVVVNMNRVGVVRSIEWPD